MIKGVALAAWAVTAGDKTASGQALLSVDWTDPELADARRLGLKPAGGDGDKFARLRLPVIAFVAVPQLVKNVVGPDAKPIEPRIVITDPKQPDWYQITDKYDGITVSVSADRRVNHDLGPDFQIGERKSGAVATLGTNAHPNITILDGDTEEGMEGIILEYNIHKFPDIPYSVTVECAKKAKSQCKDLAVITRDEGLLKVIATGAARQK